MNKVKDTTSEIKRKATLVRRHVVTMAAQGKTSHVGSALSCVDILCVLYFRILKTHPQKWDQPDYDRFILSKGHGVMAWFATLAERGFFDISLLQEYALDGGRLGEHPDGGSLAGIKVTTGSLGHGLSLGLGMAIAKRLDESPAKIFVLLSDGECNEGSVWEAVMYAAHQRLENLIAIVDFNKMQAMGRSVEVNAIEPLAEKWKAFGWAVQEVDGHNIGALIEALGAVPFVKGKPSAVMAHTVLGKGVSFMEDDLLWHYQIPSEEQVQQALRELAVSEE